MDDLIQEFIDETQESLAIIDTQLVDLEKGTGDKTIINNIFRLMHTAKGTSGFLSLSKLEKVAHAAENIMDGLREDDVVPTKAQVDVIFKSIDVVRDILDSVAGTGEEPDADYSALIDELNANVIGVAPTTGAPSASEEPATEEDGTVGQDVYDQIEAEIAALEAAEAAEAAAEVALEAEREDDGTIGQDVYDQIEAEIAALEAAEAEREAAEQKIAATVVAKKEIALAKKAPAKKPPVPVQSLRVNVNVLEDLMTLVSELVLTRNQLLQVSRGRVDGEMVGPIQQLNYVVSDLQEAVMKTRMQPVGNAWAKLPRIVRDISHELGKKIELVMEGEDTELDRQVLELIKDPLTHMVRNSCDHGIEAPAERAAAGKLETGTIHLNAFHEGGQIVIEISDDGKGLNKDAIVNRILDRGLATEAELEAFSDQQIYMFIFKPGFSTAEAVTAVSGRGVGMDVVRSNIEKIGGSIELNSTPGEGSVFQIKIPLTLAIVSALIVESAHQRFAIPQVAIQELVRVAKNHANRIETMNGVPVLRLRDELLPVLDLGKILTGEQSESAPDAKHVTQTDEEIKNQYDSAYVVVITVGSSAFGLLVDVVFDTEEIVIKPTSPMLKDISIFSGNTILGDGSVIMILDPQGLVRISNKSAMARGNRKAAEAVKNDAVRRTGEKTALLVMRSSADQEIAVPLALVSRLEKFKVEDIEHTQGGAVVQYRDSLMTLMEVSGDTAVNPGKAGDKYVNVVVFSDDRSKNDLGIVVEEIVDIVNDHLNLETEGVKDGFLGSAIITGKAVDVLDTAFYMKKAGGDWFGRSDSQLPYKEAISREKSEKVGAYSTEEIKNVKPRAMIVDDSAFFRGLMLPIMEGAGFEVTAANGAGEALKCFSAEEPYDIIVSDIEMPEINGYEFAKIIKKDEQLKRIPLIAVSSHDTPEDVEYGLSQGFDFYLEKFDAVSFKKALYDALKLRPKEAVSDE
ncbi:MAG: hybrid sensor histidine kinase/response regulator [Rickettsiales bacterium]|nr:hybrid sensor histidine kinase/response regulator [Rickettsiales bacterium]